MMDHISYLIAKDLHNCNRIMDDAFWLGVHPELSTAQLDYVIESFADFLGRSL
jgi:dTDP-4-amino-4,6-dideoxygalactose transaminase